MTVKKLNWACFFVGILIVWLATHSWLGILGTWIAALHFTPKEQA